MISRCLFWVFILFFFFFSFFLCSPILCVIVAVYTDILRDDDNDGPRYYDRYFASLRNFSLSRPHDALRFPIAHTYHQTYAHTSIQTKQNPKKKKKNVLKTFSNHSIVQGASSIWTPRRLLKRSPPTQRTNYEMCTHTLTIPFVNRFSRAYAIVCPSVRASANVRVSVCVCLWRETIFSSL